MKYYSKLAHFKRVALSCVADDIVAMEIDSDSRLHHLDVFETFETLEMEEEMVDTGEHGQVRFRYIKRQGMDIVMHPTSCPILPHDPESWISGQVRLRPPGRSKDPEWGAAWLQKVTFSKHGNWTEDDAKELERFRRLYSKAGQIKFQIGRDFFFTACKLETADDITVYLIQKDDAAARFSGLPLVEGSVGVLNPGTSTETEVVVYKNSKGQPQFYYPREQEELGHGAHSKAYTGSMIRSAEDKPVVAVKIMEPFPRALSEWDDGYFWEHRALQREIQIAKALRRNPDSDIYIAPLYNVYKMVESNTISVFMLQERAGADLFVLIQIYTTYYRACDAFLKEKGLDWSRICSRMIKECLEDLSFFHKLGHVHRDVKPENFLLGPEWRMKLIDFGLIKENGLKAGKVLGSVPYIDPEIGREDNCDPGMDVYGLGVTTYFMLYGHYPWEINFYLESPFNWPFEFRQGLQFYKKEQGREEFTAAKQLMARMKRPIEVDKTIFYLDFIYQSMRPRKTTLDGEGRASMQELLNHAWLQDVPSDEDYFGFLRLLNDMDFLEKQEEILARDEELVNDAYRGRIDLLGSGDSVPFIPSRFNGEVVGGSLTERAPFSAGSSLGSGSGSGSGSHPIPVPPLPSSVAGDEFDLTDADHMDTDPLLGARTPPRQMTKNVTFIYGAHPGDSPDIAARFRSPDPDISPVSGRRRRPEARASGVRDENAPVNRRGSGKLDFEEEPGVSGVKRLIAPEGCREPGSQEFIRKVSEPDEKL
ncbi:protein kinase [Thermoproteota archaeon]